MKAFATHQLVFNWMSILPVANETALWKRILMNIFAITVTLFEVLGLLTSVVFVEKFASIDLEGSVKTVFQIAAYANVTYVLFVAFLSRKKMSKLINKFQRIYETSESFLCTKQEFAFC